MKRPLEKLKAHFSNPRALFKSVKRKAYLGIYHFIVPAPDVIAEKSWDNLIILDACRFDAFALVNRIPGRLTKIVSAGSSTWEWLPKNFLNRKMEDVIYISANPFISRWYLKKRFGYIPFYKVVEVWRYGWNEKFRTVTPSSVNRTTLMLLKLYRNKRFIIHYLQPHQPYIGAIKLIDSTPGGRVGAKVFGVKWDDRKDAFQMLKEGKLSKEFLWKAYISNLQYVLSYVEKLLPYLKGKVVISSDHGEAFGRFNLFYGHPPNTPLPELIEVPWLEVKTRTLS